MHSNFFRVSCFLIQGSQFQCLVNGIIALYSNWGRFVSKRGIKRSAIAIIFIGVLTGNLNTTHGFLHRNKGKDNLNVFEPLCLDGNFWLCSHQLLTGYRLLFAPAFSSSNFPFSNRQTWIESHISIRFPYSAFLFLWH